MTTAFTSAFVWFAAAAVLLCAAALMLVWRARTRVRVPVVPPRARSAPGPGRWQRLLSWLRGLWRLLRTPTAARYKQRWVLLLGEVGAGKSSLIASLQAGLHGPAPAQCPGVPQTLWHAVPEGQLIDPSGLLSGAAAGTPEHDLWRQVLHGVRAQRPERALDALVLVVSARTLLQGDASTRARLGQAARDQLKTLGERLSLALPVYVVVTQTDAIPGFSAFWAAAQAAHRTAAPQAPALRSQMIGCSSESCQATDEPALWIESAWADLLRDLRWQQVQVAALQSEVPQADAYFLHLQHLAQVLPRLRDYLSAAFESPGWTSTALCRGIYLTGVPNQPSVPGLTSPATPTPESGPRADVAFVHDLFHQKVLAERGLARVTVRRLWSPDPLRRSVQRAAVAVVAGLLLATAWASFDLARQVHQIESASRPWGESSAPVNGASACLDKALLDQTLLEAAQLDPDVFRWAMPWSWWDTRPSKQVAQTVARAVFTQTVLPALACELSQRASALNSALPQPASATLAGLSVPDSVYARRLAQWQLQVQTVRALEDQLAAYAQLIAPNTSAEQRSLSLNALGEALYGAPWPSPVTQGKGALLPALAQIGSGPAPALPSNLRSHLAHQLQQQIAPLQEALLQEVDAGTALLAQLGQVTDPSADPVASSRHFTAWLNWVAQDWLGSTAGQTPCQRDAADAQASLTPLISRYGYPPALLQALQVFDRTSCTEPALQSLEKMQLPPYGALLVAKGDGWMLNPELETERDGLHALLGQGFMQVQASEPFACLPSAAGWRTVDLGRAETYARQYQSYLANQGLAPQGAQSDQAPLYQRVALSQLERVLNDALNAAQSAAGSEIDRVGLSAVSAADQQLLWQSAAFTQALQPLLNLLQQYRQNGLAQSEALVAQCVRDFASTALGRVQLLANQSRLYQPAAGPAGGPLVDLGSTAVVSDYLERQVARAQVLVGYATPFTTLLANTDGVNDAQRDTPQTESYWANTIEQLNAFVQFKEPSAQVGTLQTLFLQTLPKLNDANCVKTLASLTLPADGNDLFSQRRASLQQWLNGLCTDRATTTAHDAYTRLAERFQSELQGRYPFGPATATEASPASVRAFFLDYETQRPQLETALASVDPTSWADALDFVDQLDRVSDFLRGSLVQAPASQPMRIQIAFDLRPGNAPSPATTTASPANSPFPGSNQIVAWTLASGASQATRPGSPSPVLDWRNGQPLQLQLDWADRSVWRPVASPGGNLQVSGTQASIRFGGQWSLLRMLEQLQPQQAAPNDPAHPERVYLELAVPVVNTTQTPAASAPATTWAYIGLDLSAPGATAPAAAATALYWPGSFPTTAAAAPPLPTTPVTKP